MNINRLIYPGFWFGKSKLTDAIKMAQRGAGGFCIYGGTRENIQSLIVALRQASPLEHLFICADYEDGLGRWINTEPWVLSNMAVGASGQEEIAYQKGLTLAREARTVGVDWVFAPVLDLCDEPENPIVNTRSFGKDPLLVGRLGAALCRGLTDGGVLNCLKHFPGHGQTKSDSHLGLPILQRTKKQLKSHELIPFKTALSAADSVMIGHLLLPDLDDKNPASLSRTIIMDLLQKQLDYTGLIFTDALCMKAIGDEKQAALLALQAGAHILLAAEDSLALSDFLQNKKGLNSLIEASIRLQDNLAKKRKTRPLEGLSAQSFNQKYISSCAVWQGTPFTLKPGGKIAYLELGNEEELAAQPFLEILTRFHVTIVRPGEKADVLIAASFSNYKAFKGHINLSDQERQILHENIRRYPKSIFVSFGSPFGTEKLTLDAQLFLFSPAEEAQTCAAEILLGKQTPTGKNPYFY